MHIDLERFEGTDLQTDVAIVGAGAAGITMARRLVAAGRQVVLLESGGLDYEAATADLNRGPNLGLPYYELEHSRLRFFGGTTAIWGGRCAELDAIDFEARPWVPHSGWPLGLAELKPYYAEARAALGLPADWPDVAALRRAGIAVPDFDPALLNMPMWVFDDDADRFGFHNSRDLVESPRCTLMTHATVTEIIANGEATAIERLDVRSIGGRRLSLRAGAYVLAGGGIENPRMLLASRSVVPMGLGNGHDLVGRFFMEHPHARGGRIVGPGGWMLLNAFARRHRIGRQTMATLVAPSAALQQARGILNTSLTIAGRIPEASFESVGMRLYSKIKHDMAPTRFGRQLWLTTKRAVHGVLRISEPARPWLLNRLGRLDVALVVRAEQAPNPDSRVLIDREVDALGVPRAALDWRMTDLDVNSVAGLVEELGGEIARLGLGRVEKARWLREAGGEWHFDPRISAHPIGGYHHMGTTRMADDPRRGVTNRDGRVHGIGNLYIVGSSLFPTSGWANPTLTILALAIRSADVISGRAASAR